MFKLKLKLKFKSFEILGFPDYSLHQYGENDFRVWSKPRVTSHGRKRGNCYLTNKLIKGYLGVCLINNRVKHTIYIHQIVCWVFHPDNPDNKPTVDHIDRNPLNNRPENLRWATRKEQIDNQGMPSTNTSGVSGVCWHKKHKKWQVNLSENGEQKYFGYFEDFQLAKTKRDLEYARIHSLSN